MNNAMLSPLIHKHWIRPYEDALIESVKHLCNFYKRRNRVGRRAGIMSPEERLLREELERREDEGSAGC